MATINLGSIKFKWQGAYNAGTAYTVDDVVSYNGSSYICILASTGNLPTNTTYWEQMSQKGTDADLLNISGTVQGDLYYNDGTNIARLGAGTSGQFLKTQGTGANPTWADAGGGFQSMQVFTSSGTYTKPSGISKIKVYVTGGGGGGGGNGSGGYDAGGGGGAGGTAIKVIDATSITTETVTIGNGGSGGNGTNGGGIGQTSSFGSHCSATGGTGGEHGNEYPRGGEGGVGSNGDINLRGASGEKGHDGTGSIFPGGAGGNSFFGGSGRGAGEYVGQVAIAGTLGGGGGGGQFNQSRNGNDGGNGIIVVEEYK